MDLRVSTCFFYTSFPGKLDRRHIITSKMKALILLLLISACQSAPVLQQLSKRELKQQKMRLLMHAEDADRDGDGLLSVTEVQAHLKKVRGSGNEGLLWSDMRNKRKLDTRGRLSLEQYIAWFQEVHAGASSAGEGERATADDLREMAASARHEFDNMDADGDSIVTRTEFNDYAELKTDARKLLKAVDLDGDGKISLSELSKAKSDAVPHRVHRLLADHELRTEL